MTQDPEDNDSLLTALAAGSLKAFRKVYDIHHIKIYNFCLKLLRSEEDAKEVVQDTFVKVWSARDKFEGVQSLDRYIFTIARNLALDRLRRTSADPLFVDILSELHSPATRHTEEELAYRDVAHYWEQVINQLPPKRRHIFQLSRTGMPNKEIAAQLNISLNTVEGQVRKALKFLRKYR